MSVPKQLIQGADFSKILLTDYLDRRPGQNVLYWGSFLASISALSSMETVERTGRRKRPQSAHADPIPAEIWDVSRSCTWTQELGSTAKSPNIHMLLAGRRRIVKPSVGCSWGRGKALSWEGQDRDFQRRKGSINALESLCLASCPPLWKTDLPRKMWSRELPGERRDWHWRNGWKTELGGSVSL